MPETESENRDVTEVTSQTAARRTSTANFPRSEKSTEAVFLFLSLSLSRELNATHSTYTSAAASMIIVRRVASRRGAPTAVDAGRTRPSAFTRTPVPCSPHARIGIG